MPSIPTISSVGSSKNPKRFTVVTPFLSRPSLREDDDHVRNLSVGMIGSKPILNAVFHAIGFIGLRGQGGSQLIFYWGGGGLETRGSVDPDGRALRRREHPSSRFR